MWIKSEQGLLYNLDEVEMIDMETRANGYVVVARFATPDGRTADLTDMKQDDVEPRAVLKRIVTSIQDGDRVLDLERSAAQVKRRP